MLDDFPSECAVYLQNVHSLKTVSKDRNELLWYKKFLDTDKPVIFVSVETWLDSTISNSEVEHPDY